MKRSEAAKILMDSPLGIKKEHIKKYDAGYDDLVSCAFAVVRQVLLHNPYAFEYCATAATPLALLTPKQFICAQQLARDCEIAFDYVPKAQKTHMAKLVENGWAMMDKHGSAWKATEKLIEAIGCWQKAKGDAQ